ncbi:MAG: ECF-type sigma factor [Planctomycetota bacterium]
MSRENDELTELLASVRDGDKSSFRKLFVLVYEELKQIASAALHKAGSGHTLQPTALVHELFLRFDKTNLTQWEDRSHFFATAAKAMRHILLDHHRHNKHKAVHRHEPIEPVNEPTIAINTSGFSFDDFELLNTAIQRFEAMGENARKVKAFEMVCFLDWTLTKTAEVLNISPRMVQKEITYTMAWLGREINRIKRDGTGQD